MGVPPIHSEWLPSEACSLPLSASSPQSPVSTEFLSIQHFLQQCICYPVREHRQPDKSELGRSANVLKVSSIEGLLFKL